MPRSPHRASIPLVAADALVAAVARRLDAVLPRPLRAVAQGTGIQLLEERRDGAESWGWHGMQEEEPDDVADEGHSVGDRAARAAVGLLWSLQDSTMHALREQWPRSPGGPAAHPDSRADGEWIHLWYGPDERAAVLTLPPIPIADVQRRDQRGDVGG